MQRRFPASIWVTLATPVMLALSACASLPAGSQSSARSYSLVIDNRSDVEVVVYAVPSPGAPGKRLTTARSFSSSTITIPENVLQGGNGFTVRLHPAGDPTNAHDWVSPRLTMSEAVIAKLDIRATSYGDLSTTAFYTAPAPPPPAP